MNYALIFYLIFMIGCVISYSVWFSKAVYLQRLTFCVFSCLLSFWVLFFGFTYTFEHQTLFFTRLIMIPAIFLPFSFYLFCISFIYNKIIINPFNYFLHAGLIVVLLFSIPSSLLITTASLDQGLLSFTTGKLYLLTSFQLCLGFFQGYYCLFKNYKRQARLVKRQINFLFVATLLGLLISIIFSYILPMLGFDYLNYYSPISAILFIGIMSFAVIKHQFLNARFYFNSFISWTLSIVVYLSLYCCLCIICAVFFASNTFFLFVISGTFCAFSILSFHSLRLFFQSKTYQFFLDKNSNMENLIPHLSQLIVRCIDLNQLLDCIKSDVLEALDITHMVLFIPSSYDPTDICSWTSYTISPSNIKKDIILKNDQKRLTSLFVESRVYDIKTLILEDQKVFNKYHILLGLPCFGPANMNCVLGIGSKVDGEAFFTDDLTVFKVLAGNIALAIRHIRPYEDIKASYEKKRSELEKTSQQVAFSGLIMGISHEIRNPMTGILSRTECLEKETEITSTAKNLVLDIKKDIFRILDITDVMLRYGSPVVQEKKLLSVEKILEDVFVLLKAKLTKHRIILKKEFIENGFGVMGDANRLYQVFTNLIVNAIEAMENSIKRELCVQTRIQSISKQGRIFPALIVTIQDTGIGMDSDTLKRLYDPFFTTKYKNLGMGLSLVAKVVHDHQGLISVRSETLKGTFFTLTFFQH